MTTPTVVLMGSGEFTRSARGADQWALDHATVDSDRALVLPTASAPEGDQVFDRWGTMGLEHFEELSVRPEVVPLKVRRDAENADMASRFGGARYIFFSGGNPAYLVRTLAGTSTWQAVLDAVAAGAALGGCSAGMMALGMIAPDTSRTGAHRPPTIESVRANWSPALALFPSAYFQAHWDAVDGYYPGLRALLIQARPEGATLFGVDENTAACGDGRAWRIFGRGTLTVDEQIFPAGEAIELELSPVLATGTP